MIVGGHVSSALTGVASTYLGGGILLTLFCCCEGDLSNF